MDLESFAGLSLASYHAISTLSIIQDHTLYHSHWQVNDVIVGYSTSGLIYLLSYDAE